MAQNQTSICGLRRISPSPKIKFGFTCQPRNPNTEASRSLSSFAQSPDGEAWQIALLCISVTVSIPGRSCQAALPAEVCVERPFFAVYDHQVSHQFEGAPPESERTSGSTRSRTRGSHLNKGEARYQITAALVTCSGCSTVRRHVTRPPRSCPTTANSSKPSARITST